MSRHQSGLSRKTDCTKCLQWRELVTWMMEELRWGREGQPDINTDAPTPRYHPAPGKAPGSWSACAKALGQEEGGVVGELEEKQRGRGIDSERRVA